MECTDSNVSVDKTSKNKVSAVGAEKVVTVHSVLSNIAKIHSRLPAAMEFWLVCLGILAYSCKTPRGTVVCEQ